MNPAGQAIVACVPVEAGKLIMPDFPASATYSTYEQVPCPSCAKAMWLGARCKKKMEEKKAIMLCMICLIEFGLVGDETNMRKLIDDDPNPLHE